MHLYEKYPVVNNLAGFIRQELEKQNFFSLWLVFDVNLKKNPAIFKNIFARRNKISQKAPVFNITKIVC